jgi:glycosyltransferase involved in cell wall biosynthesis
MYEWNEIAERVASLNLSESVEMPGSVVGESKEGAYKQADIYVLPSYAEGMPIGLLEAMSYGLVCITTPVGGIPEVIQDGQNGVLIPPGDTKALTEVLDRLICEPDLRFRLGREARATIEREYNWIERANQIKELYLDMLGIQQNKSSVSGDDT